MAKGSDEDSVVTQVQAVMHNSTFTLVLPGVLFIVSMVLLFYRGVTQEHTDLPLNGFLANIMLQMLPLVMLKVKIWSCADRISLVPIVLCKTGLMHLLLGIFRVSSSLIDLYYGELHNKLPFAVDIGVTLLAAALLKYEFEFPLDPRHWILHVDVRNLTMLAMAAAFITEVGFNFVPSSWMSEATAKYFQSPMEPAKVLFTSANYMDIVAIFPIVWRLYQAEQEMDDYSIGVQVSNKSKRQMKMFFLFLGCFYGWDDVIDPVMTLLDEPLALMAHAVHFVLVLDFAGFFIFQADNTASSQENAVERGEQLGLLSQEEDDFH